MDVFWFMIFILLIASLVFAWPAWPYARTRGWGYAPSTLAATLLVLFLVLLWFGAIVMWWPWGGYY